MGKTKSKAITQSGGAQVNILNQLAVHSEWHEEHEVKLTVIIMLVTLQLLITLWVLYKNHTKN